LRVSSFERRAFQLSSFPAFELSSFPAFQLFIRLLPSSLFSPAFLVLKFRLI
ncbi:MAG: hypothetical protein ACI9IJ_000847, partial [Psychromonas sp.]